MEIKLFGKSLFEAKKSKAGLLLGQADHEFKGSKYLPDFYKGAGENNVLSEWIAIPTEAGGMVAVPTAKKGVKNKKPKAEIKITPKGVYKLEMLNDKSFKMNTNEKYVDEQLESFKDKLGLIKAEEYDMRNGVTEISSIVARMENRKKYPEFKDFFEQYPYTTTTKIAEVVKVHDHLKLGQIAQFIADMPKEAVDIMKEYNKNTDKLCGKQAVFYIVADKKDFKTTNGRRDPILVAQSPFGHFWQILGAWDDEMLFLEEL